MSKSPELIIPSPMLAHKWVDHKETLLKSYQQFRCSPKLDGIRCVAAASGLYSRNQGKFSSCIHVLEAVQEILGTKLSRKYVLDGELYMHDGDACFERICTAVKKTSKHANDEDLALQANVSYHVFDIIDLEDPKRLPYTERIDLIHRLLRGDHHGPLRTVPVDTVTAEDGMEKMLEKYIAEGFEGAIVRTPDGRYEVGKRSKSLLKYVPHMEAEFDVFDTNEGEGKLIGTLGSFTCVTPTGKKFQANCGVDTSMRKFWWERRHELVGKKVTVKYQRLTKSGVPRFAQAKSIRNFMRMRV